MKLHRVCIVSVIAVVAFFLASGYALAEIDAAEAVAGEASTELFTLTNAEEKSTVVEARPCGQPQSLAEIFGYEMFLNTGSEMQGTIITGDRFCKCGCGVPCEDDGDCGGAVGSCVLYITCC